MPEHSVIIVMKTERGGEKSTYPKIHKAVDGLHPVSDRYHLPFSGAAGHSDPGQSKAGVSGSLPGRNVRERMRRSLSCINSGR